MVRTVLHRRVGDECMAARFFKRVAWNEPGRHRTVEHVRLRAAGRHDPMRDQGFLTQLTPRHDAGVVRMGVFRPTGQESVLTTDKERQS